MTTSAGLDEMTRELQPRIAALARRLCGADAGDGAQEAFREITRAWPGFRGDAAPSTWAHRIAVRTLVRFARRQRQRREREPSASELHLTLDEAAVTGFAHDPFTRLAERERRERLHAAMQALSPPLRDVLILRVTEGLDYAAIAEALEVPLGTVKSRLAAATLRLAERLQRPGDEP